MEISFNRWTELEEQTNIRVQSILTHLKGRAHSTDPNFGKANKTTQQGRFVQASGKQLYRLALE
jgi:hypothetical protein